MSTETKYKYLAVGLAIVALVFAYLYFTKPAPTVGDIYQSATEKLQDCKGKIAAWNEEYAAQASSTEKQAALDAILDGCQESLSEASGQLETNE